MHHKRAKIRVRFVELTEALPVQSRYTEMSDHLVVADFMGVLNLKERQVVVLLHRRVTRLGEVASILGYKSRLNTPRKAEPEQCA